MEREKNKKTQSGQKQLQMQIADFASGANLTEDQFINIENEWELIFNTVPDLMAIIDKNFKVSWVNRALARKLGKKPEDCVGLACYECMHGLCSMPLLCPHHLTLSDGKEHTSQAHQNNPPADFLITTTPIKNSENEIIGSIHIARDITTIKKGEAERESLLIEITKEKEKIEQLADELKIIQKAVENASDIIFIINPAGKIIYINKVVEEILGYSPKEMIGKSPSFWRMNKPAGFFSVMWRTIYFNKKPFIGEFQGKKKNGENFTAEIHIAPVLNKKGRILSFVVIERDITENKKLDTVKKEFISLAAHQLRTPISTIGLAAEMMSRELPYKINKNSRKYLKMIMNGVKNMAELAGLFLNVSRTELGTFEISPQALAINKIIEENINKIMPQVKNKGLKLKKNIQDNLPILKIDPKIMEIILENILSNAIKYTEKGGIISIRANKEKNQIIIKISDTGLGIPKHQQPFIFEKLFRADNVRDLKEGGMGLGLYLVKSLMEQTGGKVWQEPKEGKGTTICLALPITGMAMKTQDKK